MTGRPITEIEASNSLADLATHIKAEHEAATSALKDGMQHAIVCGRLLIEAKEQLKHGTWLPWLKDKCDVSVRTAQAYMRVARGFGRLGDDESNAQRIAHFSFREALDLIAETAWPKAIKHEQTLRRRESFSLETPQALLPPEIGERQCAEYLLAASGDDDGLKETDRGAWGDGKVGIGLPSTRPYPRGGGGGGWTTLGSPEWLA